MTQEHRGFERISLDGYVYIKTSNGLTHEFKAYLDNISFGGFAVYSQEKFDLGTVIEFRLITQALDEALVGKGKIRHIYRPPQYSSMLLTTGIEFVEVSQDKVRHMINRWQTRQALERENKKKANIFDGIPL